MDVPKLADLRGLVDATKDQILAKTKARLGQVWDDLGPEIKARLEEVARDQAAVAHKALSGADVTQDQRDIDAQMANWTEAGAIQARNELKAAVVDLAREAGAILAAAAKGAVGL